MHVVSLLSGRVLWSLNTEELRPLSGLNVQRFVDEVLAHYSFLNFGDVSRAFGPNSDSPMQFDTGSVSIDNEDINIIKMEFYSDGILVECHHTNDAVKVLNEFLGWAEDNFGLRRPCYGGTFQYLSQMVLDFEKDVEAGFGKFSPVQRTFDRFLGETYSTKPVSSMARFDLDVEKSTCPADIGFPKLVLERRANIPYSQNRFFCQVGLPTAQSLEVLRVFEECLD